MLISTRGRYALRVLVDLAEHQSDQYIPLKEMSERQQISEKYMEGILKSLVQGNVVTGLRGKTGGYRLTRRPEEYTLAEILQLAEGNLAPVACFENGDIVCEHPEGCRTLPVWQKLNQLIFDYLNSVTLADLMEQAGQGNSNQI